jgi:four helix bundle protein
MTAMQDFKNLTVWQAARRMTKATYKLTTDFPHSEEFGLKAQMRRASVSICTNIAEGAGRRGDREFGRFLDVAMGSTFELECELILARDLGLMTEGAMDRALAALAEIRRMLLGLIACLVVEQLPAGGPKAAMSAADSRSKHGTGMTTRPSKP